jgi:hypothetical protein
MAMFMPSIKSIAGDCKKTHRWCKVNLTDDDANDTNPQKLSQRRIIGIGKTKVRLMGGDGKIIEVEPRQIQQVW